ncbi:MULTISPECIES: hypothetical protein [unclassified Arsukibacterium]|uniref:hypothetical protein n=1 Tax=unclassified Arsukibacterium TaxID=2635278 RepID=UPI000C4FDCAE|nr:MULTISPECIES: hypothetical protein [unclassified Arsukibacterium]MAA93502.1 hypothetical protein [Rheinheimera sp.]MBM33014.1 hypothetical protein [Rheinheimera sp.]HAW92956.1 hypothetical protein [Candidatus Azambacteria bacterium]
MEVKTNVKSHEEFKEKLIQVMTGIYELFELTKEHNLEPVSENGCVRYMDEYRKTCAQAAGQFSRPSEYLESLLDMVRVNFESNLPLSYFLNSNMGFLYEAIPEKPFQLGYISLTSTPNTPFNSFWKDDVVPYIEKCGYSIEMAASTFAVASAGSDNFNPDMIENVTSTLNAGFNIDDVGTYLSDSLSQETTELPAKLPTKQVYVGLCIDSSLKRQIRLSMWLFIHPN